VKDDKLRVVEVLPIIVGPVGNLFVVREPG